jgi:hypothetical protein
MTETTTGRTETGSTETSRSGVQTPVPAGPPAEPPIGTRGVIFGTVLLGVLLLGFALWANEAGKRAAAEAPRIPAITLLSPDDGDVVEGPVMLEFATETVLRRGPAGWENEGGNLHIHVYIDGTYVMPGAESIELLPDGTYRWTLGVLQPGTRELRLFWADRFHRELVAGASHAIRVEAR